MSRDTRCETYNSLPKQKCIIVEPLSRVHFALEYDKRCWFIAQFYNQYLLCQLCDSYEAQDCRTGSSRSVQEHYYRTLMDAWRYHSSIISAMTGCPVGYKQRPPRPN